jgi:hypothetical protein
VSLREELVHERLGEREDRTILLVRVGRGDEEAAAQVVGRDVCRPEPRARRRAQCVFPAPGKPMSITSAGRPFAVAGTPISARSCATSSPLCSTSARVCASAAPRDPPRDPPRVP